MRLNKISRRRFLKGAGIAALAVAAAGVLTGCDGGSSGNKVTPNPTPTTKPVNVTYVLDEDGTTVCTDTINVDVTKLDVTNPTISGSELTLPEKFAKDYKVMDGDYPISVNDGKYEMTVIVAKITVPEGKEQVKLKFYTKNAFTGEETDVTDKILEGRTVLVDKDAKTADVSDVVLPTDEYKILDNTAYIDEVRVAHVLVGRNL